MKPRDHRRWRMSERPSAEDFRACAGEFATGVTVVTGGRDGMRAGMTLNSFASVSLDPPLILVCLARGSRTGEALTPGSAFAVSVLRRGQRDVALAFARRGAEFPDRLVEDRDGFLLVRNSLASIVGSVGQLVRAGDHDLVLGEVTGVEHHGGEPLIFHRGRLGGVVADALAPGTDLGGWDTSVLAS